MVLEAHLEPDSVVHEASGWTGALGDEVIAEQPATFNVRRAVEEHVGRVRRARSELQAPDEVDN